jgi:hypothetical protein
MCPDPGIATMRLAVFLSRILRAQTGRYQVTDVAIGPSWAFCATLQKLSAKEIRIVEADDMDT